MRIMLGEVRHLLRVQRLSVETHRCDVAREIPQVVGHHADQDIPRRTRRAAGREGRSVQPSVDHEPHLLLRSDGHDGDMRKSVVQPERAPVPDLLAAAVKVAVEPAHGSLRAHGNRKVLSVPCGRLRRDEPRRAIPAERARAGAIGRRAEHHRHRVVGLA